MAFLTSPRQHIERRVNDLVRGDTKVGQVARVIGQGFDQPSATGVVAAYIKLELRLFALDGPDLGAPLAEDPRFVTLTPTLDGKNDTLVDASTGEILGMEAQYPDPADWGEFCRSFAGRDVMLQGDYFETLRTQPLSVDALLRAHLAGAHALGRFA